MATETNVCSEESCTAEGSTSYTTSCDDTWPTLPDEGFLMFTDFV